MTEPRRRDPSSALRGSRAFVPAAIAASLVGLVPVGCESAPEADSPETAWTPPVESTTPADRGPMPFAEAFSTGPATSTQPMPVPDPAAIAESDEVERDLRRLSGLGTTGDFMPDVDRDGTFVAFASRQQRKDFDLYRRSLLGRDVAPLVTMPGDQIMPAISPDGRFVAFASDSDGDWNVFVAPVDGGTPVRLTESAADEVHPTWSPDGERLAFSRRGEAGRWEVWTVDASAEGEPRRLAEGFLPRWSPVATGPGERSTILVQRAAEGRSSRWGLWAIDVEGTRPVEERPLAMARNAATIQACWSPDAERIAFVTVVESGDRSGSPERSDLWTALADGSDRRLLTSGITRNMQPAWLRGRGGDRILFVTDRGGVDALWSLRPPSLDDDGSRLVDGERPAD
jgi:TolB protein